MNPKISVVMPVYNGEKFLDKAICSILSQSYKDFEFIIVNDGSSDNSLSVILKYKKKDDRIVVINRENRGLISSLNEGIDEAKGEYIARMDADDISLTDRLKKQVEHMDSFQWDICGSHFFIIHETGNIYRTHFVPITNDSILITLGAGVPFAHPGVMIRKRFLYDNGMYYGQSEYKYAEDYDLWVRMYLANAVFGNVNEILLKYRITTSSLFNSNKNKIKNESSKLAHKLFIYKKRELIKAVANVAYDLNYEEQVMLVKILLKLIFKYQNIFMIRHLKKVSFKIVLFTIMSVL